MAYQEEEKNFIKKQIQKLKASKTYQGKKITYEVLAELANASVSSARNWSTGTKLMKEKYRKEITKKLELDPHYFDLEYSEEFITKKKSEEELDSFLSSKYGSLYTLGMAITEDGLKNLRSTYQFLLSLGFGEITERLTASGDTAIIASLIQEWNNVFYGFYQALEQMLEDYCTKAQAITDSYRPDVETGRGKSKIFLMLNKNDAEALERKIADLGKNYGFFLSGTFDEMRSVHFDLYKAIKCPAPEEQDKGE